MSRLARVALILSFAPAALPGQEPIAEKQMPAGIARLLERFDATASSAGANNAAGRVALFTADAVVINAFGERVEGRAAVGAFWSRLHATGTFDSSRIELLERRHRELAPGVVLVDHVERLTGQRTPTSGRELPPRVVHITLVLRQQADGAWRIAYYRAGDVRELRRGAAAAALADTLIALAEEWTTGWNDKDAERMLRLHGDDFLYGSRPGFETAGEFAEALRERILPDVSFSVEMREPRVRPLGADAALLSFRWVGEWTLEGVTEPFAAGMSLVFERQQGVWKIIHVQESTPHPESRHAEWRAAYHRARDVREPPARTTTALAGTLMALVQEWGDSWEAGDLERMRRLYSDDVSNVLFGHREGFLTVEALLEELRRDDYRGSEPAEMLEWHVRSLGADAAVVSIRLALQETDRGVTRRWEDALSLIFQRQEGEWKIVHVHDS